MNLIRGETLFSISIFTCILTLPMSFTASPICADATSYSAHDPISIDGDDAFTAANGVVGGSGTYDDPFRIEGWNIAAYTSDAVSISNTESYFVISQCEVAYEKQGYQEYSRVGISLANVSNSKIRYVTFNGPLFNGVEMEAVRNVAVEGCHFSTNQGVTLNSDCDSIVVSQNSFDSCQVNVFHVIGRISIENNIIGGYIWVYHSSGTSISGNVVGDGIKILHSSNITIEDNSLRNDTIEIYGDTLEQFTTLDISISNSVDGLPILFVENEMNLNLDCSGYGQVICANLSDSRIADFVSPEFDESADLAVRGTDITLAFCENVTVTSSEFSNRWCGVHGIRCSKSTISECSFTNVAEGVLLSTCHECSVVRNEFVEIASTGVNIGSSDRATVSDNVFTGEWEGVFIFNASDSAVFNNTFSTESLSIRLNEVREILIYHNDFMSGDIEIWGSNFNVSFDNGIEEGGNYWFMFPTEDANEDGFGDEPVIIGAFQDRYPLMQPFNYEESKNGDYLLISAALGGVLLLVATLLFVRRYRLRDGPGQHS